MTNLTADTRLTLALALYLTSIIASNTLGLKLMPFLWGTHLSVAVFFFPFVFLTTDVVGQLYGKQLAKTFVLAGFVTTALFLGYTLLSNVTPWFADAAWLSPAYATVFQVSGRMSLASLLAFLVAEYQDVVLFFAVKQRLGRLPFWLRSTISNIWSQLLDTFVFMFVAFWGVYSVETIILASLPWWWYKVGMGLAYTPLSYLGLRLLRPRSDES